MLYRQVLCRILKNAAEYAKKHKEPIAVFLWVLCFGLVSVGGGYPFGFALYLALDKHPIAGLVALFAVPVLGNAPLVCIPAAGLLYLFKLLNGNRSMRPLAAAVAMGFVWTLEIHHGVYSLAGSTPWLVLAPMFTVLYGFALNKECRPLMRHGGFLAILFTSMLAITGAFPSPVLAQSAALLISFIAADKGNMLYGGLYGFAAGLGCGTGCAAVCGVTGLCGGLFSVSGRAGNLLCGTVTGICAGFYFFGPQNCMPLFLSYALAAAAFFVIKDRLQLLPIGKIPVEGEEFRKSGTPFAEAFFAIAQSARKSAPIESETARTADQYAGFSSLLSAAEEKREADDHTDKLLSDRAATLLYGAGVRAKSVKVTGGRKKRLTATGVELSRLSLSSVELKQLMSTALGCRMKEPEFYPDGGIAQMVMDSAPRFRIECSRNGCPKKGEEISGDTVRFFSGGDGYFYALISDGMGSGKTAAESSGLAGMFLEKLLSAGADRKTALALLNGFLASRKEEVFATVDLFEADLYTGKGVIVKAGAAPSFIIRGGKCRKLQSATAPAGIIRNIKAEQLSFDLKDGDTLIMVSDGISGDGNGEETEALLSSLKGERRTAAIADLLLSDGARRTGNCDDMSVCVIKVLSTDKNAA